MCLGAMTKSAEGAFVGFGAAEEPKLLWTKRSGKDRGNTCRPGM